VGVLGQTAQLRQGKTGVGIASMRQRAKELGGEISIRDANPGTIVELVVPIAPLQTFNSTSGNRSTVHSS
jgi:signal transduction histidine kinase